MYLTRRLAWLRMPAPPGSATHSLRGSVQFKGESVASAGVEGSYAFGGIGTNTLSAIQHFPWRQGCAGAGDASREAYFSADRGGPQ